MHTSAAPWLQLQSHRWHPLSTPHMAYRPQGAMVSWATSLEMLHMMAMRGWGGLQTVLKEEIATTWKRIFAHHTWQCCRPHNEGGDVERLKEVGWVTVRSRYPAFSQNRVYQVRVQLDLLFKPDGTHLPASGIPPLVCCSTEETTLKLARENVCLEIFTFLLAIAPQKVFVASASMRNIERVRAAAQEFHISLGFPRWGTWAAFYFGDTHHTDKRSSGSHNVPTFVRISNPSVQATREEELVKLFQAPWDDKPAFFNPSCLPSHWWKGVAECIPKNGFKPWLKRHPDIFEVHELAGGGPWTFSIKANDQGGSLPTSGAASSCAAAATTVSSLLQSQAAAAATSTTNDQGSGLPTSGAASSCAAATTTVSQAEPSLSQSHAAAAATSPTTYDVFGAAWQQWGTVASTTVDSVAVGSLPASGGC